MDGTPPYYQTGTTIELAFSRIVVLGNNGFITATLYPAVVVTGGGSAGVTFNGNTAGATGGALHIDSGASNVLVLQSTFANNQAASGGALYMNNTNNGVYLYSTSFVNNTATQQVLCLDD